ncbi:hypothetical protein [uncultured Cohaesibacter sp.]|uniref:hypothetical protein n=1 Tax=uncultured Cohaesibacter sp. TaxID=1002546 RepID=UPI00293127F1|nr:hypothetical protein [uncultured Cohaesibacter sp.]
MASGTAGRSGKIQISNQVAFVPPKEPEDASAALKEDLERLRDEIRRKQAALEAAQVETEELKRAQAAYEEMARQATEDLAIWEETAAEQEANALALAKELAELQKKAQTEPEQTHRERQHASRSAAANLELDEQDTRILIDGSAHGNGVGSGLDITSL